MMKTFINSNYITFKFWATFWKHIYTGSKNLNILYFRIEILTEQKKNSIFVFLQYKQ